MERVHHHVECGLPDFLISLERHDAETCVGGEIGDQYVDVTRLVDHALCRLDIRQIRCVRDDLCAFLAEQLEAMNASVSGGSRSLPVSSNAVSSFSCSAGEPWV